MEIDVLMLEVTALQVRIMALILPHGSAIVMCLFVLIFSLEDLSIIYSCTWNLRACSASIKMAVGSQYFCPRLATWPKSLLCILDRSSSFLRRRFEFSPPLGWAFFNPWLSRISLLTMVYEEYEGKIHDKYEGKEYVIKIKNSAQRVWQWKPIHILNLDYLVVYYLRKPVNNDENNVIGYALLVCRDW